jgi:transposase-like protein
MGLSAAQEDEAVARYKSGEGFVSIGKSFGYVSGKPVRRLLVQRGVFEEGRTFQGRYTDDQKAEMIARYQSGDTIAAIARDYGCVPANVKSLFTHRAVSIRPQMQPPVAAEDSEIRRLREQRVSVRQIARDLGIKPHRVLQRCRAMGIAEKKMPRGPQNFLWKDGRTYRHGTGYYYVAVNLEDPLRVMAYSNGQVPEHRLVMARSLGRPLTRSEPVHHINGDRTDNRIENLQLRKGNHGKGAAFACLDCGSHNVGPVPLSD